MPRLRGSIMIYALTFGALLDLLLGDPRWLPHPIRGIGLLIQTLERLLRKIPYEKFAGCILVGAVLVIVIAVVMATLPWAAVYWIFNQSFVSFKLGYGAALSMILLAILVALSLIQLRLLRQPEGVD